MATDIERHGQLEVLVNDLADALLTTLEGNVLETDVDALGRSPVSNQRSIFIVTEETLLSLTRTTAVQFGKQGNAIIRFARVYSSIRRQPIRILAFRLYP